MDSVQFLVMLAGGLVIFPVAMYFAGGLPQLIKWLHEQPHTQNHLGRCPQTGDLWVFILAITLLSMKFATIDQAILQRL